MDLVLKYLDNAASFRNLVAAEQDPKVRAMLEKQARAYFALAKERAEREHLPMPGGHETPPPQPANDQ